MIDPRTRPRIYVTALIVTGAAFTLANLTLVDLSQMTDLLFFLILTFLAEAAPIRLPRGDGTVSVSFAIILASLLLYGPAFGILVATIGTIGLSEFRGNRLRAFLFNRSQLALSAGLAGWTFVLAGGQVGSSTTANLVPLILSGTAYTLVNVTAVVLYFALHKGLSVGGVWLTNFKWAIPNYLALIPIGYLIATVYMNHGVSGVVIFMIPLLIARYSFQRYNDMREVYLSTIRALTAAIEAKDPLTRGHSDRVARYAVAIGDRLGLNADRLDLLQYISILHDIGKIGIPDRILNKPGKFTTGEYDQMKTHAEIGSNIIREVRLLAQGAPWIRHHHERFDGSGYPDRLRGTEIPLEARIIAVADSFDAMTTFRPYRSPLAIPDALRELQGMSGTQFDPVVVEAFLAVAGDPKAELFPTTALKEAAAGQCGKE